MTNTTELTNNAAFWNAKGNAVMYNETGDYSRRITRARAYFQRALFFSNQRVYEGNQPGNTTFNVWD